jgi:hypothetical protein
VTARLVKEFCVASVAALLLSSCVPTPDHYPVPAQHRLPSDASADLLSEFVRSSQADADTYYLKDVGTLEGSTWRWTREKPELRFHIGSNKGRIFRLDLGIHDLTFRETGPVTLAIRINGQLLDRPAFASSGDRTYQRAVPDSMLHPNAENRVEIEVLNPWKAPDGVRLGFILHAMGFLKQ